MSWISPPSDGGASITLSGNESLEISSIFRFSLFFSVSEVSLKGGTGMYSCSRGAEGSQVLGRPGSPLKLRIRGPSGLAGIIGLGGRTAAD